MKLNGNIELIGDRCFNLYNGREVIFELNYSKLRYRSDSIILELITPHTRVRLAERNGLKLVSLSQLDPFKYTRLLL